MRELLLHKAADTWLAFMEEYLETLGILPLEELDVVLVSAVCSSFLILGLSPRQRLSDSTRPAVELDLQNVGNGIHDERQRLATSIA